MALRIGIDIGSTTVKVVVLDEQNQLLFRSYERHYSKTRERTCETLQGLTGLLGGQEVQLLITGSAGLGVAKAAGLDFVQEVYANYLGAWGGEKAHHILHTKYYAQPKYRI